MSPGLCGLLGALGAENILPCASRLLEVLMFLEWKHIRLQGHLGTISLTFAPHFPLTYLGTARPERPHPSQWLTPAHLHRLSKGDTLTGLRKELTWAHLISLLSRRPLSPSPQFQSTSVVRCHGQSKLLACATQLLLVSPSGKRCLTDMGYTKHPAPFNLPFQWLI